MTLKEGSKVQQWVGKKGIGNYFTTVENGSAQNLALTDYDVRELKTFTVTKDVKVLRSTASNFQGTVGGGTQYFSPELRNALKAAGN